MTLPSLVSIDPGSERSALVHFMDGAICGFCYKPNHEIRELLKAGAADHLCIETLHPRGEMASIDAFRTQLWAGRFIQVFAGDDDSKWTDMDCNRWTREVTNGRVAGDGTIRRALIDRFGGDNKAIGGKRCKTCKGKGWTGRLHTDCTDCWGTTWEHPPGPLHGMIGGDLFSALGIGVAWHAKRGIILPLYGYDMPVVPSCPLS